MWNDLKIWTIKNLKIQENFNDFLKIQEILKKILSEIEKKLFESLDKFVNVKQVDNLKFFENLNN